MGGLKNFIHKQTVAKVQYYKRFSSLGIKFDEYCDYIYGKIDYNTDINWSQLFNVKIKRINSYSFIHTVEEIFINELYKFESGKNEPLILDCGANIGLSTIYFKKLFPKAKVVAFEPDNLIFEACQTNLKAFGFNDVELINSAVWKFDGVLNFLPDNSLGGMIVDENNIDLKVNQVTSVDLKKYLIKEIDFLKMDIEGAELDVLLDCKENLSLVKNMFVEYHSDVKNPQQLHKLLELINEAGFRYYIKSARDFMEHPLVDFKNRNNITYDLQLNIFAYRV